MKAQASRLASGKFLLVLVILAACFALLTLTPTFWARGQVNRFMRDLARVWTVETLLPNQEACAPIQPRLASRMAAALSRANNHDPNMLLHQGQLACVQGDLVRAARAWQQAADRTPPPPVENLFAAIASFAHREIIDTAYRKGIGTYGYNRGNRSEKADKLSLAVDWYEFSFAYDPSGKTAGKLAVLYGKLGRDVSAEDVWMRLQTAFTSDSPEYWWAVGQIAEQQKDWEAAARAYHQAATSATDATGYKYLLREGLMWLRARAFEKSAAAYQQAIARAPKKVDGYLGMGHVYRYQKQYQKAFPWYEKAIEVAPNHYAAYYYLGTMAREQGDYTTALRWFDQALARNAADALTYYQKALTLDALGRREEAITALEEAIRRSKTPRPEWQSLLARWRSYPEASSDPQEFWRLGQEAEQAQAWNKAADHYKLAAELAHPQDAYPYLLRWAMMLERIGETKQARDIYLRLTQEFPEESKPYELLGSIARREGELESARQWFLRAIQAAEDEEAYWPLVSLGAIARDEGAYAQALQYFQQAQSIRDDEPTLYFYWATVLDAQGDRQAARAMLEQAISLTANPSQAWLDLLARWETYPTLELDPEHWAKEARTAETNQELERALSLYEKAASLAQGVDAYPYLLRIGSLRIRLRDYEGAEEAYRQALALNDESLDPYIGLGESYRYRGEDAEAEAWYRKALALAPDHWRPLHHLGIVLYKQGRYEEALQALNTSLAQHPANAWGEYFRALSLWELDKRDAAIASLERAITFHTNPPESWQELLAQWKQAAQ